MPVELDEGTAESGPGREESPTPHRFRRPWRPRLVDAALGALAMLVVVLLAGWLFWTSVSTPVRDATRSSSTSSANDPSRVPQGELAPPADLPEDQLWLGNVSLSSRSLIAAATPLQDVQGSGRNIISGPDGISAEWVRLTGTVPFDVVAAEMGPDTALERVGQSEVRVLRTIELLGRNIEAVATGTVDVVDGRLVMEPTNVRIIGAGFLDGVLTDLAKRYVNIEHEIEGLPEGLVLQHVSIGRGGFRATLEGTDVLLTDAP